MAQKDTQIHVHSVTYKLEDKRGKQLDFHKLVYTLSHFQIFRQTGQNFLSALKPL